MKQKEKIINIELGKVPPQAPDLEAAVLGAIMIEKWALNKVVELLKPESFYLAEHQAIYQAIVNLRAKGGDIDILTVTHELRSMGKLELVGGALFVSRLPDRIGSTANIEQHSRIVLQMAMKREMIQIAYRMIEDGYSNETDIFQIHADHSQSLSGVLDGNVKQDAIIVKELISPMMDDISKRMADDGYVSGTPTSISSLKKKMVNYGKTDLIIIAARPGMGKTGFLLSEAYDLGCQGIPSAIFTMEMSKMQLMFRMASLATGIDIQDMSKKKLTEQEFFHLNQMIGKIERLPIFIDDTPDLSAHDCRVKSRRLVERHGVQMIFIDYLQLMNGDSSEKRSFSGNREQEISKISRECKITAKECDVPVMALSQLSRAVETRAGDKRPQLSDLRESGSIEQDADVVGFVHRPAYYPDNTEFPEDYAEIIIRKCRNGALGVCKMKWTPHVAKFSSWENPGQETINFHEPREPAF